MLLVLNKSDQVRNEDEIRESIFETKLKMKKLENMMEQIHVVDTKTGFGIPELGAYLSTYFIYNEEEEMAKTKLEQISSSISLHKQPLLLD